jgi:hypothetical protein
MIRIWSATALVCLLVLGGCNKNPAGGGPGGKMAGNVPENEKTQADAKKVNFDETNQANKTRAANISRSPTKGRVSRIWLDNTTPYRLYVYVQGQGESFAGWVRPYGDAYADVWHSGTVAQWGYGYDDNGNQVLTWHYKEFYVGDYAEYKIRLYQQ